MEDCTMDDEIPISSEEPASSEEFRNWGELTHDVLSHIFQKLGAIDILFRAQSVCSTWRQVSKEPLLFRSIDTRDRWDLFEDYDMEKIAREAVDRSCGQLVEFSLEYFGSDELVTYIADKCGSLRYLRLVSCDKVSDNALINVAKKAVMLEEIEICHCSFSEDMIKTVGKACPQLTSFRLSCRGFRLPRLESDEEALPIAENMPQLRHLHLFGNKLTNVGLRAILDGCLHLESIDLRQCFNVNLEGDLLKICGDRLIIVRLPNDSTDDYEFDDAMDEYSYYSDLDYDNELNYNDYPHSEYRIHDKDKCYYDYPHYPE